MDKFMKELFGYSQMHDEIQAAKEKLVKMKSEYRQDVYLEKARPVVQAIVKKATKLRTDLASRNRKLEKEIEKLKSVEIKPKNFITEKLYKKDEDKKRVINTDYLTNFPLISEYIIQQLKVTPDFNELKQLVGEITEQDDHDVIIYEALKNALETFKPIWYNPDLSSGNQDAKSFDYDLWLSQVLNKLEYAIGTDEEKACFDRLVAAEKELEENLAEFDRLIEAIQFKAEINLQDNLFPTQVSTIGNADGYWSMLEKEEKEE